LRRARTADVRRALNDPDLPSSVSDFLLDQGLPGTVRSLEELAQLGDVDANLALVRLERFCTQREQPHHAVDWLIYRSPDSGRGQVRRGYLAELANSCSQSLFDLPAIERRLRESAGAGHAGSLLVLGQDTTGDEAARRKLWTSAAILGDVRAQLLLAANLREAGSNETILGERAAFWLKVAASNSTPAAVALARCRALGCDGGPVDGPAALELMRNAARRGNDQALELLGAPSSEFPIEIDALERHAWLQFLRSLWRHGCYGEAQSAERLRALDREATRAEAALSPYDLRNARQLAESYWSRYAVEAQRAQRCS
jgi:TPR repeat protein